MEKKNLINMNELEEELFVLAVDQILKDGYEYIIEELEEEYIDYEYFENLDFDNLDEEYLDELIESFSEETEKENGKQIVKTRI